MLINTSSYIKYNLNDFIIKRTTSAASATTITTMCTQGKENKNSRRHRIKLLFAKAKQRKRNVLLHIINAKICKIYEIYQEEKKSTQKQAEKGNIYPNKWAWRNGCTTRDLIKLSIFFYHIFDLFFRNGFVALFLSLVKALLLMLTQCVCVYIGLKLAHKTKSLAQLVLVYVHRQFAQRYLFSG